MTCFGRGACWPRVPCLMGRIPATFLLILATGCATVPKEVLPFGAEREISWNGIRVTAQIVRSGAEVHVYVQFWAPGFTATSLIDPLEGVRLTLEDGKVVESQSKIPEVISWSGGSANAWSEKSELVFSVPEEAQPSRLELRCGLGTLECRIEN